ncbi:MAG: hypothetical protein ACI9RZ_001727, partial [Sphingobacteriales bacterium]
MIFLEYKCKKATIKIIHTGGLGTYTKRTKKVI